MYKRKVAILTDFVSDDPAYSLCRVVAAQIKMLTERGYTPRLLVRKGFQSSRFDGSEIVTLDPGEIGNNQVNVTSDSDREIESLTSQLQDALEDCDVVLTHDLIYQPNLWKYHVAARRVANAREDLRWVHWVHSASPMSTIHETDIYQSELQGWFPNSKLVAMHGEEVKRKQVAFNCPPEDVVIIPNPVDFMEHAHPAARQAVAKLRLMAADVVGIYPCRLDRGKQPHIAIELFGHLISAGYDARLVICDFHSTDGSKAEYRKTMKALAVRRRVPLLFTSDLKGEENGIPYSYCIPHQAVIDLMQVADVLIHMSRSESDPLIIPEAAWARCGLALNFDNPVFRVYDGQAVFGKFSSNIDVTTGLAGETRTEYTDREGYLAHVASKVAHMIEHNRVLALHARMRKERSLEGVWLKLWGIIEGNE